MTTLFALWIFAVRGAGEAVRITERAACECATAFRSAFVDPYHLRLLAQAEYLYRNSELYKVRLRERGYVPASEGFHGGVALYFFEKARRENRIIRLCLVRDAVLNLEPVAYDAKGRRVS